MREGSLRRRLLEPVAEEADLGWVGFHTCRHTCASMLVAEGRNAVQVQRWLGEHSAAFRLATRVHLLDADLGAPLRIEDGQEPSEGDVHTLVHTPTDSALAA
jgi:integrase